MDERFVAVNVAGKGLIVFTVPKPRKRASSARSPIWRPIPMCIKQRELESDIAALERHLADPDVMVTSNTFFRLIGRVPA